MKQVVFLVDTGADSTTLMPRDALYIGVDYRLLGRQSEVTGLGGTVSCFQEPAYIAFNSGRRWDYYQINLDIAPFSLDALKLQSVLGRDIIDRWRVLYSPSEGTRVFEPLAPDWSSPL